MAITKIHSIKRSVAEAVNYIIDPDKTDDELHVSSYACAPYTADIEFRNTANRGTQRGDVKAQHLIQSFAPGEVDPDTAHKIGYKLAMELTNGEHEFIISTHIDKGHIHNHIIFNQVSFTDYKKFRENKSTLTKIRNINDKLCASYGLSVIEDNNHKALPYHKYKNVTPYASNRKLFKNLLDSYIPLVNSFDELIKLLEQAGYECKITKSNYSFKRNTDERFMRLNSLGEKYSYDSIIFRINNKNIDAIPYVAKPTQTLGLLTDLSNKMEQLKNPAYANKVALSEVKKIAATYSFLKEHNINSVDEINKTQTEWAILIKDERKELKDLEDKIKELETVASLLKNREDYRQYYRKYVSLNKDQQYYDKHSRELILFEAAAKGLAERKIDPKTTSENTLAELNELKLKYATLHDEYKKNNDKFKKLRIASQNIDTILERTNNKNKRKDISR